MSTAPLHNVVSIQDGAAAARGPKLGNRGSSCRTDASWTSRWSNTRSATILGIVGAGGVGFLLYDRISANNWDEVMSIVILILITVYAIDSLSGWLRGKIIGKNDYRP